MKITQVSNQFVRDNYTNPNLYRLLACDDGHPGHSHTSVRIKPVRRMTVDEILEATDDFAALHTEGDCPQLGFILVETDNGEDKPF